MTSYHCVSPFNYYHSQHTEGSLTTRSLPICHVHPLPPLWSHINTVLATTNLFSICIILSFLEYCISENTQHGILRDRFFFTQYDFFMFYNQVVACIMVHPLLLLSGVVWYKNKPVYSTIYPPKDIQAVSYFLLL